MVFYRGYLSDVSSKRQRWAWKKRRKLHEEMGKSCLQPFSFHVPDFCNIFWNCFHLAIGRVLTPQNKAYSSALSILIPFVSFVNLFKTNQTLFLRFRFNAVRSIEKKERFHELALYAQCGNFRNFPPLENVFVKSIYSINL